MEFNWIGTYTGNRVLQFLSVIRSFWLLLVLCIWSLPLISGCLLPLRLDRPPPSCSYCWTYSQISVTVHREYCLLSADRNAVREKEQVLVLCAFVALLTPVSLWYLRSTIPVPLVLVLKLYEFGSVELLFRAPPSSFDFPNPPPPHSYVGDKQITSRLLRRWAVSKMSQCLTVHSKASHLQTATPTLTCVPGCLVHSFHPRTLRV
jgi:hypothetical protein